MKSLYLLLGNGNSIGIINQINAYRQEHSLPTLSISLTNLFYYGSSFNFPMTTDPFLTQQHCPNLWQLGARPFMDSSKANEIISNIITCGNVFALSKFQESIISDNNYNHSRFTQQAANICIPENRYPFTNKEIINKLYYNAYCEFTSYIRYLIIWYNSQVTDEDLLNISLPLLQYIIKNYNTFEQIVINDYNYDIFMERLMMVNNVPFYIGCFQESNSKIVYYKPHGSISFSYYRKYLPNTVYYIPYDELSYQQQITLNDLQLRYNFANDYPMHNAMVPPFGDAERYDISYYQNLRNSNLYATLLSKPDDLYYIIGCAYGTYNRFELDRINTRFDKQVIVTYVNPSPNSDYNAVLTSLFPHYTQTADFMG